MACGVPVVAFDNPWGHWLLRDGETACCPGGPWTAWPTIWSGCAVMRYCAESWPRVVSPTSPLGMTTGTPHSLASMTGCATRGLESVTADRLGVLLITPQPLGPRMAGPAIRTLELAAALARDGRGGPVTVVSLSGVDRAASGVALTTAESPRDLRRLVEAVAAVVIQGDVLGLHPWLVEEDVPLVVDAYDPYHLEQLEQARPLGPRQRRAVVRDCVRSLNIQLARADLVLCASPRQRSLWIGHLAALGRINPPRTTAHPTCRLSWPWFPSACRAIHHRHVIVRC